MHPLVGYCERWSVRPGSRIGFMVSSAGDAPFDLRFVRHLCADPNPNGPGYAEIAMPTAIDGARAGRFQPAWLGSHGRASGLRGRSAARRRDRGDDLADIADAGRAGPGRA